MQSIEEKEENEKEARQVNYKSTNGRDGLDPHKGNL